LIYLFLALINSFFTVEKNKQNKTKRSKEEEATLNKNHLKI